MSRLIKFRGQIEDNKEWVYGSLIEDKYIVGKVIDWNEDYFNTEYWWRVIPETVGQFTGLFDKNGKEIYEGDILSTQARDVSFEIVWVQENSSFMFKSNDSLNLWEVDKSVNRLEVIGNIHDNGQTLHTCNEKP